MNNKQIHLAIELHGSKYKFKSKILTCEILGIQQSSLTISLLEQKGENGRRRSVILLIHQKKYVDNVRKKKTNIKGKVLITTNQ
jgi:hypothetical protein